MILQSFVNLILMQFYSLHQVFNFHDIKISMLLHVQFSFPKLTGIDKMIKEWYLSDKYIEEKTITFFIS